MTSMQTDDLLRATIRIAAAYLSRSAVSTDQLASVIRDIHDSLRTMGTAVPEPSAPTPAVPIRRSIKADAVICLECGKPMKMLKRHLGVEHSLSVPEYKARWRLPADYPVVAPAYAQRRSEFAKQIGLGRKPAAEKPAAEKPAAKKRSRKKVPPQEATSAE